MIGGSERQGFRKHSLCSEKKEQITQILQTFCLSVKPGLLQGPFIAYAVFLVSVAEWQTSLI